jgi:hypothetical protein
LGWGNEHFLDYAGDTANIQLDKSRSDAIPPDSTEWSIVDIHCDLDDPNEVVDDATLQKAESLSPLIDEWYTKWPRLWIPTRMQM